ncbi:MAG TPA: LPXTG cell wall anchor domain-containing protein [Acidimicrobiales bacterium]|jgi:LPXTG-motif cell wall-anchored protein|nr:LPXTG cell wall anchor domain-containing protein [Acidimicrobiales bacterium]
MRSAHRLGAIALAGTVMAAMLALPASAQTTTPPPTVQTRAESFIATAAARGLDLNLFGTHVTIGQSSAVINSTPSAKASGAGVALVSGTVSSSEVDAADQSATPPKACVLNLPVANLLTVNLACGESRVDTTGGAPSAFGAGSVAGVDLAGLTLLQPIIDLLQSLLNAILPVVDQTVGTVVNAIGPTLGGILGPLAGNLGLGSTSNVAPVSGLVTSLLDGIKKATSLVGIKLGDSTAQAATAPGLVTATATAAGAQIDLLPGLAAGGAPLLSIIVGQAKSVSTFDRSTAKSTPTFDAAVARVHLGLPLLGTAGLDIPVQLNTPLTLLAGTPLETTISLGAGRTATDPSNGSVASYADGVSIQLLKGINGGIGLDLAHAETGAGGQTRLVSQQEVVQQVPSLPKTGNDAWLPMAGAGLLLAALGIRRRLVAAQPVAGSERVSR